MIIKTRYRDIPWEGVRDGFPEFLQAQEKERWPKLRGRPVTFITPDVKIDSSTSCKGPFFKVTDGPIEECIGGYICPHIAEIGD